MSATRVRTAEPEHALLTVAEVARRLRISEASVRRHFDSGDLAGVKLGSVRRVFASELDRLVQTPSERNKP
jgi:excisionase family DNA binding protein